MARLVIDDRWMPGARRVLALGWENPPRRPRWRHTLPWGLVLLGGTVGLWHLLGVRGG